MTIDILLNHYALFNCRYLLSTFALPQQAFKSYEVSSDVVLAEFKFVTPVLFTYKLEKVDFNTNMYISYVAGLRIDSARRTVSHMWLKNGETAELPAQQQAPELLSHQVFNTKAVMKVRLAGKAFAVLSYSAYPTIRLFVDGKAAKYWETAQGTICIPLEPGEHEIIIKAGRSGMALLCCSVSGFLFVLMMVYLFLVYRKNKKAKELK
jgi:hypothetical protein